jgi:hypothetical protein
VASVSAQISIQEQREEVQRVLESSQFRRSPKLQRLLELICDYHFQGRSSEITEYLIATEAFGKSEAFDSSQDSLVRVQAREARRRLREYYQSSGAGSGLMLDIPLGSYAPHSYRTRQRRWRIAPRFPCGSGRWSRQRRC